MSINAELDAQMKTSKQTAPTYKHAIEFAKFVRIKETELLDLMFSVVKENHRGATAKAFMDELMQDRTE